MRKTDYSKDEALKILWNQIQEYLSKEMDEVDVLIKSRIQNPVSLIADITQHLIGSGGKRIRPLLLLLSAKLVNYKGSRHINLAAAIEFIHTATLLHDDVIDESSQRRGSLTAQCVWGNKASILVGDFLFSRAFECMVADGSLRILKVLSHAASLIAQGEVLQLSHTQDLLLSEMGYMEIIESKTAALFEAASQTGAILGDVSYEQEKALALYGKFLGIIFQMTDDLLDYKGTGDILGKESGADFRERKATLPSLLAYKYGNKEEKEFWDRVFTTADQDALDFEKAQSYLQKHKIFEKIQEKSMKISEKFKETLSIFESSKEKDLLLQLVDFAANRIY